jgi:type II secretory pathway predicted ATPase ExeA
MIMTKQKDGNGTVDFPIDSFGKSFPKEEIFSYSQFQELHQILALTVRQRTMLLVTGEAGVGKTTAVRTFTDELPTNKHLVIYVGQDQDGGNLSRRLATALGFKPLRSRSHTWLAISQHLSDNLVEQGKEIVLVIDEAHLLDNFTLEDIRLLTNADFDRSSPLSVIMLGQLALRSRLKMAGSEALNQRLKYRYALEGFSEEETAQYIKHRLRSSGGSEDIFQADALKHIFLASQGIPREINNLCTVALLKAQSLTASKIDAKLVRQVLDQRELN